jgi:hypothetical protein
LGITSFLKASRPVTMASRAMPWASPPS